MNQQIVILVDNRRAVTAEQAADIYGKSASGMRTILFRIGFTQRDWPRIGNKPLYDLEQLDAAMAARPGSGAPGRPKPRTAKRPASL